MNNQTYFKSIVTAALLLGTIAVAALGFQPGSISNIGQGGGYSNSGWGNNWGGGGDDD